MKKKTPIKNNVQKSYSIGSLAICMVLHQQATKNAKVANTVSDLIQCVSFNSEAYWSPTW